jgi:hypothetical protein
VHSPVCRVSHTRRSETDHRGWECDSESPDPLLGMEPLQNPGRCGPQKRSRAVLPELQTESGTLVFFERNLSPVVGWIASLHCSARSPTGSEMSSRSPVCAIRTMTEIYFSEEPNRVPLEGEAISLARGKTTRDPPSRTRTGRPRSLEFVHT